MINSRSRPHNEYLLSSIPTEEKEAVNSLRCTVIWSET